MCSRLRKSLPFLKYLSKVNVFLSNQWVFEIHFFIIYFRPFSPIFFYSILISRMSLRYRNRTNKLVSLYLLAKASFEPEFNPKINKLSEKLSDRVRLHLQQISLCRHLQPMLYKTIRKNLRKLYTEMQKTHFITNFYAIQPIWLFFYNQSTF